MLNAVREAESRFFEKSDHFNARSACNGHAVPVAWE